MSVQRSVFTLTAEVVEDPPGTFTLKPSEARMVPKGATFIGAQFQLLPIANPLAIPPIVPVFPQGLATFEAVLQGRNGRNVAEEPPMSGIFVDVDWVDVLGGVGPVVGNMGPESGMFDGPDQLVRVTQFAEIRLIGRIVAGTTSDFAGVKFAAYIKTDYPTG